MENNKDILNADDRFATLVSVLIAAYHQAATGKGNERHGNDLPFDKQPILAITRMVGLGFPCGQIQKKAQEACGMVERGAFRSAEAELLGVINYAAAAFIRCKEMEDGSEPAR